MSRFAPFVLALASFAFVSADDGAVVAKDSGAVVTTRPFLTLGGARRVVDTITAEAARLGVGGAIAVVDEGGALLCLQRLDGTFAAASEVSTGKARTAARFKKPTKAFEDSVNGGRFSMTALPDFTPLQGGVPLVVDGQVVGAVGVSGASSAAQDEEFALLGAKSLLDVQR